jgi:hypothetical protein
MDEVGNFTRLRKSQANFRTFCEAEAPPPRSSSHLTIMESANASAEALRKQIEVTEAELARLKAQLAQVEATKDLEKLSIEKEPDLVTQDGERRWPLLLEEYKRYGRQMIVPSVGIQGISSLSLSLNVYIQIALNLKLSLCFGRFC